MIREGMQVVAQRLAFAQEFGAEHDLVAAQPRPHAVDKADRDGRLDHDGRLRIGGHRAGDHRFDRRGIELIGRHVIIGRRRHDHQIGPGERRIGIERGDQIERPLAQERLQFRIHDRRLEGVGLVHALGRNVHRHHGVILRQQHGIGQADIAQPENSNLHSVILRTSAPAGNAAHFRRVARPVNGPAVIPTSIPAGLPTYRDRARRPAPAGSGWRRARPSRFRYRRAVPAHCRSGASG